MRRVTSLTLQAVAGLAAVGLAVTSGAPAPAPATQQVEQLPAGWTRPGDPTTPDVVLAQASAGKRFHFPGSVRLADGTILVAVREGAAHSSPDGRIMLLRSKDAGRTWSPAEVIHDSTGDDRDPKLSVTSTGRVFLHMFISDPGAVGALTGDFVRYSDDEGATWSESYRINTAMDGKTPAGAVGWAASHGRITETADGTLLAPLYGKLPADPTPCRASVVRSLDDGETWLAANEVFLPTADCVNEAVLTALPDGSLTALLRVDKANTPKWQMRSELTRSFDNGRTWTPAVKLDMATSSAETLVLSNGDVLLAYGDHTGRYGQRRLTSATILRDPNGPWKVEAASPIWDAFVDDQANPTSVEVAPGRVMIVGFDYSSRTLNAKFIDVATLDKVTDAQQLAGSIDLLRMVERGQATIDTTLTAIEYPTSAAGPLGAVDGKLGMGNGAMGGLVEGSYTIRFAKPQLVRSVGVALRPGEAQPATVEVQGLSNDWFQVGALAEKFRFGDVDWLSVPRNHERVKAVRVTTKPMVGPRPPNSGATKPIVLSELALR